MGPASSQKIMSGSGAAGGLTFLFFLSCGALVQSQDSLLVRWNNSVLIDDSTDDRELIYHDEIAMTVNPFGRDGPGILACRIAPPTSSSAAGWRRPDDTAITTESINNDFIQYMVTLGTTTTRFHLARARDTLQDGAGNNGLWTCNGGENLPPRHVALYNRGDGAVVIDSVSLEASPSFSSTSPRFTLIVDTSGGPPTTFSWRNDAGTISNGGPNSISIEVNPNNDTTGRMNCHYRSTLEVTAVAPGTYTCVATNRATSGDARMSFVVEGGSISNLQVVQIGMNMVELTWDPPPGPPSGGYRVVDLGNNIDVTTTSTRLITMLSLGLHNFQVMANSQHFPIGMAGPEVISVGDALSPVITLSELTATSVRVSWTQPMFSFTVSRYEVAVRRLTTCYSLVNIRGPRPRNANETTDLFEDLGEYISYRAEVRVLFESPSSSFTVSPVAAEMNFTTLGIAPSEVPSNVRVLSVTSRTISVSWDAIDCGNQNGPNFLYDVEFQQTDGRVVPVGTVNDVTFIIEGLQPFTIYAFRVRGVNDVGNGDYTELRVIQTSQDGPGVVTDLESQLLSFTSVLISWSLPQEPNGIIITYELTYLLNGMCPVSQNTSNRLNVTINDFNINTGIEVRVRAYTMVGPGPYALITLPPLIVTNIRVEKLTETSVRVTWDRITDISGVTEYIVYYAPVSSSRKRQDNEQSVTVPSTENSVEISGLESIVEYQYQVTAVAMSGGRRLEGNRSPVTDRSRLATGNGGDSCQRDDSQAVSVSVSVIVTFLLTIILYSALLLVGYYIIRVHGNKSSKKSAEEPSGIAMKENAAYGPVTSSQQPQDHNTYTQPDAKIESEYEIAS